MKPLRMIAAGLALSLVAACSTVTSNTEGYSVIPADITPRTVNIAAADWMDGDSLSFQANASLLAGVLAEKGFASVGKSDARLLASYSYQTHPAITKTYTTREPVRRTSAHEVSDGKGGTTTERVTEVVGYRNVTHEQIVYPRVARLTMTDAQTGKQVYDGVVTSEDNCTQDPLVYKLMLDALLKDFPASQHGSVNLTVKDAC